MVPYRARLSQEARVTLWMDGLCLTERADVECPVPQIRRDSALKVE